MDEVAFLRNAIEGGVAALAIGLTAYTIRILTNHLTHVAKEMGKMSAALEKMAFIIGLEFKERHDDAKEK